MDLSSIAIILKELGLILCSYPFTFDDALKNAATSNPEERVGMEKR
jgi:hypothetical protein